MLPHDCLKIVNSDGARYRLLYVGDDLELLRALRKVLTKPDYHIVSCPHVGSAILFLEGNPRYDLLVFDLELRGKSVIELTRLARSMPHRAHLPIVIVMTNEIVGDLGKVGRQSGVGEWVSKRDIPDCAETIISLLGLGIQRTNSPVLKSGTTSRRTVRE